MQKSEFEKHIKLIKKQAKSYDFINDPEGLKNFRANLSGADYFSQFLKAIKKAYVFYMNKEYLSLGNIFDYSTKPAWFESGHWSLTQFDQVVTGTFRLNNELIRMNFSVNPYEKITFFRYFPNIAQFNASYIAFYPNSYGKSTLDIIFTRPYSTNAVHIKNYITK